MDRPGVTLKPIISIDGMRLMDQRLIGFLYIAGTKKYIAIGEGAGKN